MLPMLAELAGAELPTGVAIGGRSFAPLLRGEKQAHPREGLFRLPEGDGRFFDCGVSRDGTGYRDVTDSAHPEVVRAR